MRTPAAPLNTKAMRSKRRKCLFLAKKIFKKYGVSEYDSSMLRSCIRTASMIKNLLDKDKIKNQKT